MYENKRNHYRVSQKNISANPQKGIYITEQQKNNLLVIGILLAAFSFIISIISALKISK